MPTTSNETTRPASLRASWRPRRDRSLSFAARFRLVVAASTAGASLLCQTTGDAQSLDFNAHRPAAPPPLALPTREAAAAVPVNPWFVRPPLVLNAGPASDWRLTIYGFAEADGMWDSTESFNDGLNNNVIAHPLTQEGTLPAVSDDHPEQPARLQRSGPRIARRSRHRAAGVRFVRQPTVDQRRRRLARRALGRGRTRPRRRISTTPRFASGTPMSSSTTTSINILAGQTYYLLGWQNYFFGATCGFLGLPNELFNRTVQLRLSHTFGSGP